MNDTEKIIVTLENSIRTRDKLADLLFYMTTIDERRSTLHDTLALIEPLVTTLNDGLLYTLYESVVKSQGSFKSRYEQILQSDLNAFLKRLSEIWGESAIEANEAGLALRELLGLDTSRGIYGAKGWRPSVST